MDGRTRAAGWMHVLVQLAAATLLFAWSRDKWTDSTVDNGRELYAAWRVAAGDVLYRDVAWFNGPFSVWWNAGCFKLFGVGLSTLVASNLAWLALTIVLLWRQVTRFASPWTATLACLVFQALCAFSQYGTIAGQNFVAPYSHELTHGFALALGALELARGKRGWQAWSFGLVLALCFLTKPEPFLAAASAGTLAFVFALRERASGRARHAFLSVAGFSTVLLVAFAALNAELERGQALRALLGGWWHAFASQAANMPFYRAGAGFDDPARHVDLLVKGTLAWIALGTLPFVLLRKLPAKNVKPAGFVLALVAATIAFLPLHWVDAGRPLIVLTVVWLAVALWRRAASERIVFGLFTLALLLKLGIRPSVAHYGFVLAVPALMLFVVTLTDVVPARLEGARAFAYRCFACGLFVGVAAGYLQLASSRYADFEHEVGQGPDRFLSDARGRLVESARRTIDARLDSDAELLVLPEGVLLNYLTRRASPTPYVNFMPPELAFFGEETMLEALRANPPELVALVHKDTSEYGFRFFGRDYGLELMRWLEANYRRGQLTGAQPFVDERFGIVLYERR